MIEPRGGSLDPSRDTDTDTAADTTLQAQSSAVRDREALGQCPHIAA